MGTCTAASSTRSAAAMCPCGTLLIVNSYAIHKDPRCGRTLPSKVGGYDMPRGMLLIVNAYDIHRDPAEWEDPAEFRPTTG